MSDRIRIDVVTVHAPDALALARFSAEITGGAVQGNEHDASVSGPGGRQEFQGVAELEPPPWSTETALASAG